MYSEIPRCQTSWLVRLAFKKMRRWTDLFQIVCEKMTVDLGGNSWKPIKSHKVTDHRLLMDGSDGPSAHNKLALAQLSLLVDQGCLLAVINTCVRRCPWMCGFGVIGQLP